VAFAVAVALACIVTDPRAQDVAVLDLRGTCSVFDSFVIATGASDRQMRAVIGHIDEHAQGVVQSCFGSSGQGGTWILADYIDAVVHLFDEERRYYCDPDLLWADATRVEWPQSATP